MAQLVVVVQVLVAQRDPEHPLAHQRRDLMLDQILDAAVVKARGKPIHQLERTIRRPQKQRAGIRE